MLVFGTKTVRLIKKFLNDKANNIFNCINHVPKRQCWYKFFITFGVFLFSYFLIYRNNSFFNGDMGIVGLITQDFKSGKFYSWFFYGQDYFGNLEPFILAILTFFSGLSIKTLYFWEHFFYFLSTLLLICSIKNCRVWQIILFPIFLFFAVRFYYFTYAPQGFAFANLIIISFFFLLNKFYLNEINNYSLVGFLVGVFTGLSLWHYQLYVIITPIFFLILINKKLSQKEKIKLKSIFFYFLGLCLGIIPFVLSTISSNFRNIETLIGSGSNSSNSFVSNLILKFYNSTLMYLKDFFYYFLDVDGLSKNMEFKKNLFHLLELRNIWGLVILFAVIFLLIYSFKFWRENLIIYLFLFLMMFLLLYRGNPFPHTQGLFGTIRYSIPVYSLIYFLMFKTIVKIFYDFHNKNLVAKNSILVFASMYLIVSLCIFSLSNIKNIYVNSYLGKQSYEIVLDDLKSLNVKYLYCEDFYEMCATLAFIGYDYGLQVQIVDFYNGSKRNPRVQNISDKVVKSDKIMSLVKKAKESDNVVKTYIGGNGNKYYLIENY